MMKKYNTENKMHVNKFVFYSSAIISILLTLFMGLFPKLAERGLIIAQQFVSHYFGWFYMLVMIICLVFVFWLAFSKYGALRLGPDNEKPDFSYLSWVSMLFSSGIGIALLYFGAYEPLHHFLNPPTVSTEDKISLAQAAMAQTFLHWGLHGWALYGLMAVSMGYFTYRRNLPLALRSVLHGLLGNRYDGWMGNMVDAFAIIATLIAMVTNLGIGALVCLAGLNYLFDLPESPIILVCLVIFMMLVATFAAVSGVEKGIAWLSNFNVRLLCVFLFFVFITGPTSLLLDGFIQNTGNYIGFLLPKSFEMYLFNEEGKAWSGMWTIFYWAWWIAWAPFVGMFIARISKGRTIKEVILGVLLIPLGFTLAWLSIFGNTALNLVLSSENALILDAVINDPPMVLFRLLENLPFTTFMSAVTTVISFMLFLTPVDSGTLMIANLSMRFEGEFKDSAIWMRVFWAITTTAISIGLLLVGNFSTIQMAVVLCGLPFSIVIVLYMISLRKALFEDIKANEQLSDVNDIRPLKTVISK
ncbi:BCCT family transporter [Thorsellia kenyensis]|uniref:BCCT family transporter n=1 Tax=Thorsellia kenyensis TaxID=1549888 RepID=A0ABV6C900_9GAMM